MDTENRTYGQKSTLEGGGENGLRFNKAMMEMSVSREVSERKRKELHKASVYVSFKY